MVKLAFVLAPRQNAFFGELADALRAELETIGVEATIASGDFPEPRSDLVYALLPPHEYSELRRGDVPMPLLGRTVFVSAGEQGSHWFGWSLALPRLGGAVFAITAASVRGMRELGIAADHLPLGYAPAWDHFDSDAQPAL